MDDDEPSIVKLVHPVERPLNNGLYHKVSLRRTSIIDKCEHRGIAVDPDTRRVRCTKCDALLDPIQCLVNMAYNEQRLDERVEEIRKAREQALAAAQWRDQCDGERARERIKTLPVGSGIWLESKHGGHGGIFVGVEDEHVCLAWKVGGEIVHRCKLDDMIRFRKNRKWEEAP